MYLESTSLGYTFSSIHHVAAILQDFSCSSITVVLKVKLTSKKYANIQFDFFAYKERIIPLFTF